MLEENSELGSFAFLFATFSPQNITSLDTGVDEKI